MIPELRGGDLSLRMERPPGKALRRSVPVCSTVLSSQLHSHSAVQLDRPGQDNEWSVVASSPPWVTDGQHLI